MLRESCRVACLICLSDRNIGFSKLFIMDSGTDFTMQDLLLHY